MDEEQQPSSWPERINRYRFPILVFFFGFFIILVGVRIYIYSQNAAPIELDTRNVSLTTSNPQQTSVVVHIDGAVEKPGVYSFAPDTRVQELLVQAGGLSLSADRNWVAQQLNLAQKLTDGMKIYIPRNGEIVSSMQTGQVAGISQTKIVSINQASQAELESLAGIGPVTATKIIANRPYQNLEELVSKKSLTQSAFNKIKPSISL